MRFTMPLPKTDTAAYLDRVRHTLVGRGWNTCERTDGGFVVRSTPPRAGALRAALGPRLHERIAVRAEDGSAAFAVRAAFVVRYFPWLALVLILGVQIAVFASFGAGSPRFWTTALSGAAFLAISTFIVRGETERLAREMVHRIHDETVASLDEEICA